MSLLPVHHKNEYGKNQRKKTESQRQTKTLAHLSIPLENVTLGINRKAHTERQDAGPDSTQEEPEPGSPAHETHHRRPLPVETPLLVEGRPGEGVVEALGSPGHRVEGDGQQNEPPTGNRLAHVMPSGEERRMRSTASMTPFGAIDAVELKNWHSHEDDINTLQKTVDDPTSLNQLMRIYGVDQAC